MNKKPVFLRFLYLLRAITFCTLFAFVSEKAYSAYTPSSDCPENASYVNSSCQCNTGFTQTNNNYIFNSNTKVSSANKTNYVMAGNGYEYTVPLSGLVTGQDQDIDITGQVMLLSSDKNQDLDSTPTPGTNTGGNKCWCRIVEPFTTIWKYSTTASNLENCVTKCISKINSANVTGFYGAINTGVLMDGEMCELTQTLSCDYGYENINDSCVPINYSITYKDNDKYLSGYDLINYSINSGTITLPSVQKTGYIFNGWCDGSQTCTNPIRSFTVDTNNLTNKEFYAQWTNCPTGWTTNGIATDISDCVVVAHPGTYLNPNNIDKSITGGYTYIKDGDGYTQQPEFTNAEQNSWKVFFDYGNLSGRAACSDIWAEYGSVNQNVEFNPTTWYGYNCWCDIEQYGDCTLDNRTNCSDTNKIPTKSKWVSFGYVDDNRCWQDCAGKCANAMEQNEYLRSNALSTIALQVEDCPAGYYCPNTITINYGNMPDSYNNKFECPEQYPDSDKNTTNISYCFKACDEKIGFTVSGIDYYGNDVTDTCIYTPNTYTVTYDINYNGGTNPEAASYTVGGSGITLPTVTRNGYTLDGWYTASNEKINSPYTPTNNITLYAKWTEISCNNTQYFDETTNSCIECPAEYPNSVNNKCSIEKSCPALVCPEHSTCSYIGATTWIEYINEPTTEHCQIQIEDCDIGYTSNGENCVPNTYTVTYEINYNGRTNPADAIYTVAGNAITLPMVNRDGYNFDGWYTASNEKINSPYTPDSDITLYAHWIKAEFICESGKWYHIGFDDKDKICLYAEKKTSPAIAFANAGEEPYYILLSQDQNLKINNKSDIKMHVYIDGNIYNAYDESVNQ